MNLRRDISTELSTFGYKKISNRNECFASDVFRLVENFFTDWRAMSRSDLIVSISKAQDVLNQENVHHRCINDNLNLAEGFVASDKVSIQSVVYLRVVRPKISKESEFLDFHRESFYCDQGYINYQINFHIPIYNYTAKTSMKLIKGSHVLNDDEIVYEKKDSVYSGVERFSEGHRVGLQYNPKVITRPGLYGPIEDCGARVGDLFCFTTKLLHGGGINMSDDIRISLDFGIIASQNLFDMKEKHHASYSGGSHFVPLRVNGS